MKKDDVAHLASLARIKMSDQELASLEEDLNSIVSYVSVISDIAGDVNQTTPTAGSLRNVFRADVVTNEADEFTNDLLAEMPDTNGRYMKVQKILKTE